VRLLREALALRTADREARMLLVQRLIALDQFDEARTELEPILNTDAARNEVQEALAEIDLGRGKFEEAINRYDRLARRTRDAKYVQRLEEIKVEWSAANMPPQYRTALESESLTRADFAVLLYWTVPSVRFAQRLATPPIAIDITDVAGREEVIRAIAIGLYEVDAVTRRVSPYRQINAARLAVLGSRVLSLRGAACARQVPPERDENLRAEKILSVCSVPNPASGVEPDSPVTGRAAQRMLEQIAKQV
jgi:tetratricopeptide (TPR) repeat protein